MVYLGIVCNLQSYLLIYHQAVPMPSPSQVLLYSLFLFSFPKEKTKVKIKRQRVFPFINSHSNIFLITSHPDTLSCRMGPKGTRKGTHTVCMVLVRESCNLSHK